MPSLGLIPMLAKKRSGCSRTARAPFGSSTDTIACEKALPGQLWPPPVTRSPVNPFRDVPRDHWAYDAIDQLVAITFANIAVDLLRDGVYGRMVGVQNGCYAHAPLPASSLGARKVDIANLYNTERYRPNYTSKLGAPLLFNHI